MSVKIYSFSGNAKALTRVDAKTLAVHLNTTWKQKLSSGVIKGDPSTIRRAHFGAIEVRLCPWRANRPQPASVSNADLKEAHQPCVFDKEKVIDNEGLAAFETGHSLYYLLLSLYPVSDNHFLLVKSSGEEALLSQYIHSPYEIEELIDIHRILPAELSFLFNSNPGGSTESGASKNHFHLHVLQFGENAKRLAMRALPEFRALSGVAAGKLSNWPVSLRVFESHDFPKLAREVYLYADVLNAANNAYNLVFFKYPGGLERIVVIPRTLGVPVTPFEGIIPQDRLGGDAHVGSICSESNPLAFEAMQAKPREAAKVLSRRLRETIVSPPTLAAFDQAYLLARSSPYDIENRLILEGLDFVLDALPAGFINRLNALSFNRKESQNPILKSQTGDTPTITVSEIQEKLDIIDHVLEIYRSLRFFKGAETLHALGELNNILKEKGNRALTGENGLRPSIHIILELSHLINQLLKDPALAAALYAGIFIHDLGKFISQTNHFENSFILIRNNPELRKALEDKLTPEQIEIVEIVARYHSLFTDMMVLKERDILLPYEVILNSSTDKEKRLLANDLLYMMSILDTDAYFPGESRLANDRLTDLQELHAAIQKTIAEGKSIEEISPHDDWGKSRFKSWVLGNTDQKEGKAGESLSLAQEELVRLFPSEEERESFFFALGSINYIGLIFDLRKEIENPKLRVRLLHWLCRQAMDTGENRFEFMLHREKGKWVGPQVELMNNLLKDPSYLDELSRSLRLEKNPDGVLEVIFPS